MGDLAKKNGKRKKLFRMENRLNQITDSFQSLYAFRRFKVDFSHINEKRSEENDWN